MKRGGKSFASLIQLHFRWHGLEFLLMLMLLRQPCVSLWLWQALQGDPGCFCCSCTGIKEHSVLCNLCAPSGTQTQLCDPHPVYFRASAGSIVENASALESTDLGSILSSGKFSSVEQAWRVWLVRPLNWRYGSGPGFGFMSKKTICNHIFVN